MKYFDMVKEDVLDFIKENDINILEMEDYELEDMLWAEDSVTGNASGTYTFDPNKAKEYVLADFETVVDALTGFGCDADEIGEKFLKEDWEWFDVTARCYVLGQVVSQIMEEAEADMDEQPTTETEETAETA